MSADAGAADRLSDRLDAFVMADASRLSSPDSDLDATIERFFATDDAPAPSAGLADRLWEEIMGRTVLIEPSPHGPVARSVVITPLPARSRPATQPDRGSLMFAYLATAALVLLALVGSIVAFSGSVRFQNSGEQVVLLPAITDVSQSPRSTGVIADDIVLQATIEESPPSAGEHWLGMERIRFAPGAVERAGRQTDTGVGPEVFLVEEGQLTFEAEGTTWLTRAGEDRAAPAPVLPGTEILLEVGDQFYAPSGVGLTRRNDSLIPATILWFSFGTVGDVNFSAGGPLGVTYDFGFPDKTPERYPEVPAVATVRRLTLAPGAELAVRDLPGLEMVYVEAGTLDLVYAKPETPATPERSFTIRAGSGTPTFGRTPEQALLANRGSEPLVILAALVVPVNSNESTPQAP